MKFDELDQKMRVFETAHDHCALPGLFLVARIDGRCFTRLTKEVHRIISLPSSDLPPGREEMEAFEARFFWRNSCGSKLWESRFDSSVKVSFMREPVISEVSLDSHS